MSCDIVIKKINILLLLSRVFLIDNFFFSKGNFSLPHLRNFHTSLLAPNNTHGHTLNFRFQNTSSQRCGIRWCDFSWRRRNCVWWEAQVHTIPSTTLHACSAFFGVALARWKVHTRKSVPYAPRARHAPTPYPHAHVLPCSCNSPSHHGMCTSLICHRSLCSHRRESNLEKYLDIEVVRKVWPVTVFLPL